MLDANDTYYPGHVIGKLMQIDGNVLQKLLFHADAVVERHKKGSYRGMEVEEGNPVVPNPWILLKNVFRGAANLTIASYQPTHIIYPSPHPVPDSWGQVGILSGWPMRTKITISAELAEAAVFYIERDRDGIMNKSGITARELQDLRIFAGFAATDTHPSKAVLP